MADREDAIEAGAKAIGAHRKGYGWERDDETWKNYVTLMEWVVDAVEPIFEAEADRRVDRIREEIEAEVRERIAQGVLALWDEQCCGYRNPMKCESCRAYGDVLTHAVGWTSGEQS